MMQPIKLPVPHSCKVNLTPDRYHGVVKHALHMERCRHVKRNARRADWLDTNVRDRVFGLSRRAGERLLGLRLGARGPAKNGTPIGADLARARPDRTHAALLQTL